MFNSNVKCIETIVCKFFYLEISVSKYSEGTLTSNKAKRFSFFLLRSPRTFVLGVCTFGEQENGVLL